MNWFLSWQFFIVFHNILTFILLFSMKSYPFVSLTLWLIEYSHRISYWLWIFHRKLCVPLLCHFERECLRTLNTAFNYLENLISIWQVWSDHFFKDRYCLFLLRIFHQIICMCNSYNFNGIWNSWKVYKVQNAIYIHTFFSNKSHQIWTYVCNCWLVDVVKCRWIQMKVV